jgi:hypothetical protein
MRLNNIIKIGIGTFVIGIILWQLGVFYRYNYLTSKLDIILNQPKIVDVGVLNHFGIANNGLNQKFGFTQDNVGCFISDTQYRAIKSYNSEIEKHLEEINGKDWRERYQIGIDSIIKLKQFE